MFKKKLAHNYYIKTFGFIFFPLQDQGQFSQSEVKTMSLIENSLLGSQICLTYLPRHQSLQSKSRQLNINAKISHSSLRPNKPLTVNVENISQNIYMD